MCSPAWRSALPLPAVERMLCSAPGVGCAAWYYSQSRLVGIMPEEAVRVRQGCTGGLRMRGRRRRQQEGPSGSGRAMHGRPHGPPFPALLPRHAPHPAPLQGIAEYGADAVGKACQESKGLDVACLMGIGGHVLGGEQAVPPTVCVAGGSAAAPAASAPCNTSGQCPAHVRPLPAGAYSDRAADATAYPHRDSFFVLDATVTVPTSVRDLIPPEAIQLLARPSELVNGFLRCALFGDGHGRALVSAATAGRVSS